MGCHHFNFNGGHGIITLPNIYKFGGFTFEFHQYLGVVKLRNKDLEPAKFTGRKFFATLDKWVKLTKKQQEKTRIYG